MLEFKQAMIYLHNRKFTKAQLRFEQVLAALKPLFFGMPSYQYVLKRYAICLTEMEQFSEAEL